MGAPGDPSLRCSQAPVLGCRDWGMRSPLPCPEPAQGQRVPQQASGQRQVREAEASGGAPVYGDQPSRGEEPLRGALTRSSHRECSLCGVWLFGVTGGHWVLPCLPMALWCDGTVLWGRDRSQKASWAAWVWLACSTGHLVGDLWPRSGQRPSHRPWPLWAQEHCRGLWAVCCSGHAQSLAPTPVTPPAAPEGSHEPRGVRATTGHHRPPELQAPCSRTLAAALLLLAQPRGSLLAPRPWWAAG